MGEFVKNDYGEMPVVCGDGIFAAVGKIRFIRIISFEEVKVPSFLSKNKALSPAWPDRPSSASGFRNTAQSDPMQDMLHPHGTRD